MTNQNVKFFDSLETQDILGRAALYLHKATLRTGSAEGLQNVARYGNDSGPLAGTPEFLGAVLCADKQTVRSIEYALLDLKDAVRLLEQAKELILKQGDFSERAKQIPAGGEQ